MKAKGVIVVLAFVLFTMALITIYTQFRSTHLHNDAHAFARSYRDLQMMSAAVVEYLRETNDQKLVQALLSTNSMGGNRILASLIDNNNTYFESLGGLQRNRAGFLIDRWGAPYRVTGESTGGPDLFELKISFWSSGRTRSGPDYIGITNIVELKHD